MGFQFISSDAIVLQDNNCVSAALQIQGNISAQKDLFIANTFEGNIFCKETVFVAEHAIILGSIEAANVVIWGKVKGDIKAHKIAAIGHTAIVEGQLLAQQFVLTPDATLAQRPQFL